MANLIGKKRKEAAMLARMVGIYCRDNHSDQPLADFRRKGILDGIDVEPGPLCDSCARLLAHGLVMLVNCPYEPKPSCKHCQTPCYRGEYRPFVKRVMRHSGMKLIRSGRFDLLARYFF